jgi:hypothetical protein
MTDSLYPHEEAMKVLLEDCPLWLSILGIFVSFDTMFITIATTNLFRDFMVQSHVATLGYQLYIDGGLNMLSLLTSALLLVSLVSFMQFRFMQFRFGWRWDD